jgi:hypothetical protein
MVTQNVRHKKREETMKSIEDISLGCSAGKWLVAIAAVLFCGTGCSGITMDRDGSQNPGGNSGMMPVDAFTADKSPRALAFTTAWLHAISEYPKHKRLEGEAGIAQRKRVVDAYSRAIQLAPEAPPCPSMLMRTVHLWNSSAVAPEEPSEAIEVCERLRKEYPSAHRYVLQSLGAEAYSHVLAKNPQRAVDCIERISGYRLPEEAKPQLKEYAAELVKQMTPLLDSCKEQLAETKTKNEQPE